MDRRPSPLPVVLLAVPGLALAVVGLFHPHSLSYGTAQRWYALHVPGLLVFPLVGLALAWLVRGRSDPLAWLVRLSAYVYATFYSALDVISGIAAGYVTRELGPGVPRPDEVRLLFRIGTPLGEIGSWALLGCCLLVVLDQLLRARGGTGPGPAPVLAPVLAAGVALVLGAWLIHSDHIFAPRGAAGSALVGIATAALGWSALRRPAPPVGRPAGDAAKK